MSTQPAIFSDDEILESHTRPFVEKEWRAEGSKLVKEHDHRQWELGEWMDEGVEGLTKKKALRLAMQITGYAQATLWDFARTAKAFRNSRHRDLSWSHHKELAISKLSDAVRSELLDRAAEDPEKPWTIQRLRTEVNNELKKQRGEIPSKDLRKMQVSVSAATYKFFTKLAKERKEKRDVLVGNILNSYVVPDEKTVAGKPGR